MLKLKSNFEGADEARKAAAALSADRRTRRINDKRAGSLRPCPCSRQKESDYTWHFRRRVLIPNRAAPSSMSVAPPSGTEETVNGVLRFTY